MYFLVNYTLITENKFLNNYPHYKSYINCAVIVLFKALNCNFLLYNVITIDDIIIFKKLFYLLQNPHLIQLNI